MRNRPKITIERTQSDVLIDLLSVFLLIGLWAIVFYSIFDLPDIIPMKFDSSGAVTSSGSKFAILILPIISTITYIKLRALNNYPHTFNYAVKITEENALVQYTAATKMLRSVNFAVVWVMFVLVLQIIGSAKGFLIIPHWLLMMIIIASVFIPIGYYMSKSLRNK
jgi:hypothetical protein